MAEWDDLESRLKELGAEAAQLVEDPLDPVRVRKLGDRRRLRRSVAAVLVAVAILVSGGVGVYAVTAEPQRHSPSPVSKPTSTPTPSPEPSEEASGYGERIPTAKSDPGRGRQPVPPTYSTNGPASADPTSEPTETPEPTDTSEPTETAEPTETPEPTATTTDDPEPPPPTSEPTDAGGGATQTAPPPSDPDSDGG